MHTVYRQNPKCLAAMILLWPGMIATIGSCYLLIKSQIHDDMHGPLSHYGQQQQKELLEAQAETQPNDKAPSV